MGIVKVEKQIKVHKDGRVFEALALFDTGSRRSYFSKDFAEKIGYEPYKEPKDVPLSVKGKNASSILAVSIIATGAVTAYIASTPKVLTPLSNVNFRFLFSIKAEGYLQ